MPRIWVNCLADFCCRAERVVYKPSCFLDARLLRGESWLGSTSASPPNRAPHEQCELSIKVPQGMDVGNMFVGLTSAIFLHSRNLLGSATASVHVSIPVMIRSPT